MPARQNYREGSDMNRLVSGMSKAVVGALLLVVPVARGQDVNFWGNYAKGSYPLADQRLRFYAVSYVGNFADKKGIWDHAWQAVNTLDRDDATHLLKDGDGNFNEVTLGADHVFIIGWWDPTTRVGAFMATIPNLPKTPLGYRTPIYLSDRPETVNTGWNRQTWNVNGHPVSLQLGCNNGRVQWQLGYSN